jgi:hypothetical protein
MLSHVQEYSISSHQLRTNIIKNITKMYTFRTVSRSVVNISTRIMQKSQRSSTVLRSPLSVSYVSSVSNIGGLSPSLGKTSTNSLSTSSSSKLQSVGQYWRCEAIRLSLDGSLTVADDDL